jgi:uncharacterized protein (TIGR03643 family)
MISICWHWPIQGRAPQQRMVSSILFQSISIIRHTVKKIRKLSDGEISLVIQLAWEDRTSFESIQERTGLAEAEVISLMRLELKPASFRLWRKRVKGRATKHRALRSPEMKFHDRQIADHRRANC